jgi:hypothetical protein
MEQLAQQFAIVQIVEMLKRVSPLAYKIELPPSLAGAHGIFYVSQLWKCVHCPSHVMNLLIFYTARTLSLIRQDVEKNYNRPDVRATLSGR